MPLLNRGAIANFFGLADEEEYEYQDYPETTKKAVQPTKKNTTQNQPSHSVSAANTHEKQKTATSRPVTHESIQPAEKKKVIELHQSPTKTVAKERTASRTATQPKATLVNFHLVEEKQARRIVDFLTGTVYALDGDIKRVGDEIFLCTPTGMEIDSSTAQSFADANLFDL